MKRIAGIAIAVAALIGCGNATPSNRANQAIPAAPAAPSQPPNDAAPASTRPALGQSLVQIGRQPVTPVDFEQLAGLLPDWAGWTRSKPRGEQMSMGTTISRAQAQYDKGEVSIDLEITDSSFNQLLLAPMTTFLVTGFSERTNEGYKKSLPLGGHPAFESWNGDAKRAEVTVVIANRFIVQGTGHSVDDVNPVRALVQAVDFAKIAAIK